MEPKITVEPLLSPQENYNLLRREYIQDSKAKKAEEFKHNIRKGTGAFAKKHMYPVVQTIAGLSPLTAATTALVHSGQDLSKGFYGAAALGIGIEAFPYGVGKVAKISKPAVNYLKQNSAVALKMLDKKAGDVVEQMLGNTINPNKFVKAVNKTLDAGVGIKKLDVPIQLSYVKSKNPFNSTELDVLIGGDKTGTIRINPVMEKRPLTDILKRKPLEKKYGFEAVPKKGYSLEYNYPFGRSQDADEVFNPFLEVYEGKGLNAEIKKSITRNLGKQDMFFYSSAANKTPESIASYAKELKRGTVKDITIPRKDKFPIFPANRLYLHLDN